MKPILFNTEMVKAILDGRKTQTRRICKDIVEQKNTYSVNGLKNSGGSLNTAIYELLNYKHNIKVGDVFWVREPVKVLCQDYSSLLVKYTDEKEKTIHIPQRFLHNDGSIASSWIYKSFINEEFVGVPNGCIKEMVRIFLRVTNIRVERLQDISDRDIELEGIPRNFNLETWHIKQKKEWIKLWNSTAKDGYKWENNPCVFVYEFEIVNPRLERGRVVFVSEKK